MDVNVDPIFALQRVYYCRVGFIPFRYLGVPVGVNPRKEGMWDPLV